MKRDLRAELLAAEAEARDKKRKAEGKPPLELESGGGSAGESGGDEESNKRRKLLQDALELDKDEDDDEDAGESGKKGDDDDEDECVVHLEAFQCSVLTSLVQGR